MPIGFSQIGFFQRCVVQAHQWPTGTFSHRFCFPVAPKLHKKTDNVTGAMILYVANADQERFQEFNACQKLERKGPCVKVEWVCHAAL